MLADNKSAASREEAILELGEAVRYGEKAQDPRRVGWALYHTAELLREKGQFDLAAEKAQRAVETLGRIGDRVGQSLSMKVRGQIAMERGEFDRAKADLSGARQLLLGLKNTLNEIDVVLRLAQLASARGDRTAALQYIAELGRLDLATARPDLAGELQHLQETLVARG
jgi:ATP/maltotriose-dependent transcriptional regulator MalT